ncbi:hypothetical protein [Alkalibacillus aidingensis]|uniref:hypothetical protein n=1 Tax=Alkalibacillus aidingensis TaxID=2747607 RepID=UPI0016603BE4|nr:hypothetical protein [Alkalibacillus aidingensis]
MQLNNIQVTELAGFRVVSAVESMDELLMPKHLFEDMDLLFKKLSTRIDAPNEKVLASMWMRRFAFLTVAQLFMFSKYRLVWTGDVSNVNLLDRKRNDQWLPDIVLNDGEWKSSDQSEICLNQILKQSGAKMIDQLHERTRVSKRILWENIWSYVIWMYSTKLMNHPDYELRARYDLGLLMNDKVWQGAADYSLFNEFADGQAIDHIFAHFKRMTCCLNLKTQSSGGKPCPYCPKLEIEKKSESKVV